MGLACPPSRLSFLVIFLILKNRVLTSHHTHTHVYHVSGRLDFVVLEARGSIGGRMRSTLFPTPYTAYPAGNAKASPPPPPGDPVRVELGANWIHGPYSKDRSVVNPLWKLKEKWGMTGNFTDYENIAVVEDDGTCVIELKMARYRVEHCGGGEDGACVIELKSDA